MNLDTAVAIDRDAHPSPEGALTPERETPEPSDLFTTVGLVGRLHGTRYLATLFGIVMLSHQVGGFLGAWLGGYVVEHTGSYDWLWYADIMLALGAALIHLPIKEAPKLRPAFAN